MMAQQANIDNISNNLANYQTTGFKKSRVSFEDLLYAAMETPGTEATGGKTQIGMGVRTMNTQKMRQPAAGNQRSLQRGHRRRRLLQSQDGRRQHRLHP